MTKEEEKIVNEKLNKISTLLDRNLRKCVLSGVVSPAESMLLSGRNPDYLGKEIYKFCTDEIDNINFRELFEYLIDQQNKKNEMISGYSKYLYNIALELYKINLPIYRDKTLKKLLDES